MAGLGRIDVCFRRGTKVEGYVEFNFGEVLKREWAIAIGFLGRRAEGVSPPKVSLSSLGNGRNEGGRNLLEEGELGCCRDMLGFG